MKVTIQGIDKALYKQTRIDAINENKTMGEVTNEALRLRRDKKDKADKNKAWQMLRCVLRLLLWSMTSWER